MSPTDLDMLLRVGAIILTPLLAFVAAWGGVKVQFIAIRRELDQVHDDIREVRQSANEAHARIAALPCRMHMGERRP